MTSLENSYHSQLSSMGKPLAQLLLLTVKDFHWCFVSVKLTSWITPWNSWPTSLSTQKQAALDDGKEKQWKWWGRKTRYCVSNTIWDFHLLSNRDGIKTKSPECQNVHSDDKRLCALYMTDADTFRKYLEGKRQSDVSCNLWNCNIYNMSPSN